MTMFKTDWIAGNTGHATEHNRSGVVLNDLLNLRMFDPIIGVNDAQARTANNAAFAAALAAAKRTDTTYYESAEIVIPAGDYHVDQPITIEEHWGLRLRGLGRGTHIYYHGSAASPLFYFKNSRDCHVSDLLLIGQGTDYGVQLSTIAGGALVSHHNTFRDVEFQEFNRCVLIYGTLDANNDFHQFDHCNFRDYTLYGVDIGAASQSYGNMFTNCMAWAGTGGQAALRTGNAGGSFEWNGGGANANGAADFILGRHYNPMAIRFFISENSARFVTSEADGYLNLSIDSCRWNANSLHADREAIKIDNVSIAHLSIRNSKIGDGQSPTVGTLINFAPTNANADLSGFEFVNNWVFSSAVDVFDGREPTLKSGNIQVADEVNLTFAAL